MRVYQSPKINVATLFSEECLSSLNDWLNENSLTDAGITTYIIQS